MLNSLEERDTCFLGAGVNTECKNNIRIIFILQDILALLIQIGDSSSSHEGGKYPA